jgi:2,5-diketo-D-gluconate reductase A
MLHDPVITAIAATHGKTPAQIVLRWHVQSGYIPAPKSSDAARQAANLDVFSFTLSDAEFAALNGLAQADAPVVDADVFGH